MKKFNLKLISFILLFLSAAGIFAHPAGYYHNLDGKNKASLKTALYACISTHTALSYGDLWDAFQQTDVRADGKVWDMYSNCTFTFISKQCGNYQNVCDCYNREHSFPKSWFDDATPMYSDLFHLYPTDGKVNVQRSNYPYGETANGTTLTNGKGKLERRAADWVIRGRFLSLIMSLKAVLRGHIFIWLPPTKTL